MEAAFPTVIPFSLGGAPATAKLLVLGPISSSLIDRSRSLNLEHVSAVDLMRQEISRQSPAGRQAARAQAQGRPVPDEAILAPLRRWFWTRKPDAGFVLTDFPATLLQAQVFDEWLECRGVALTGVVLMAGLAASDAVYGHYRSAGIEMFDSATFLSS